MTARLGTARKNYEAALAAGPRDTSAEDAAEAAASTARADAQLMIDLYDEYYPQFDLIHGRSLVYGVKVSEAQAALDQIETAEAVLTEFSDDLGRLEQRRDELAGEIDNLTRGIARAPESDALYEALRAREVEHRDLLTKIDEVTRRRSEGVHHRASPACWSVFSSSSVQMPSPERMKTSRPLSAAKSG